MGILERLETENREMERIRGEHACLTMEYARGHDGCRGILY